MDAESDRENVRRLLQHKNEQLETAQAQIARYEQELGQYRNELKQQDNKRKEMETRLAETEQLLLEARADNGELRKSVQDLKSTLRIQAESQQADRVQQQLNETLLSLENERKETAALRLKLDKQERQIAEAYAKRDQEREQGELLGQQISQLEHVKGVLIEEKRKLDQKLGQVQADLIQSHRQMQDQAIHQVVGGLALAELDVRWQEEREAIRDSLYTLVGMVSHHENTQIDKWQSWMRWLEQEESLVHQFLEGDMQTNHLEHAQQLLAIRWYLLEYIRQAVLSAWQESAFLV